MALRLRKRSRRHSQPSRRTPKNWAARGGLAVGFAVLGYFSVTESFAHVIAKVDPEKAFILAPDNGIVLAKYAQSTFTRTFDKEPNSLPADLARKALLADPTAADALTVLGFQAQLRNDPALTDRIFSYSTALTRRELRPRLWAIETSIGRGDIVGALRNYDVALRTSDDAAGLLFPILSAALAEERIRVALRPILASDPVWKDSFVDYAAKSGVEPAGTIALFQESVQDGLMPNDEQRAYLVNALFEQDRQNDAWAYLKTFRPGVRRNVSRDANFELDVPVPTVFDWRPNPDPRISAAILRQGNTGLLDFSIPPSVGGALISQIQLLPPGSYRLEGRSRGIEQPNRSRPYWVLSCAQRGELGRIVMSNSNRNGGRFGGQFDVPVGCPLQTLTLVARSTDDILGVSGQILSAQLVPSS